MSVQLFCIPYAGGRATVFNQLSPYLNDNIELVPLEFSGHGYRVKEPFYKSFDEMIRDIATEINNRITSEDIALFGYSMGSVVAFETVLNDLLTVKPKQLFFASHEAPGEHWDSQDYDGLSDGEFFEKMIKFGGLKDADSSKLNNKFFRKLIFDPIKADYFLISDYKLKNDKRLDVPAVMMYSQNDVPTPLVKKWQNRFCTKVEFFEMGNNHFFINEMPERIAQIINSKI